MKLKHLIPVVVMAIAGCTNDEEKKGFTIPESKISEIQQHLNTATATDFPGLSLSIYNGKQAYNLASGYAVVQQEPMGATSLQYMQSISKTFTAIAILKLRDEGKINLNEKIKAYLPQSIWQPLANGDVITVQQLLNMTSGLPDYLENDQFFNDAVSGNLPMPSNQILGYVNNKPAHFYPGTDFQYSNINYHLLALIINQVAGTGHRQYITNRIITAYGLSNTHYIAGTATINPPVGTVSSYLDYNGTFENINEIQLGTVQSCIGDDGIIATPEDIAVFYDELLNKKTILQEKSLKEMLTYFHFPEQPDYGYGIYPAQFSGLSAIGHDGSGAGAAAMAFYFPSKKTTVALCTNTGTLTDPNKEEQLLQLWQKIIKTIFEVN